MIEYALIIAVISFAVIKVGPALAAAIQNQFNVVSNDIGNVTPGASKSKDDGVVKPSAASTTELDRNALLTGLVILKSSKR